MTTSNILTHTHTSLVNMLLRELWWLLPQISFDGERGSYVKGKLVCVLVDTQPGDVPGTFHAGLTLFPLTDEHVDMAGIGLVLTGWVDGQPKVCPMRRGVTNHRGCLTLKDLPAGRYRLLLSKGVVSSGKPVPIPRHAVQTRGGVQVVGGLFDSGQPRPLIFQEYKAEDGSLTCILYETKEEALLLDFEASPPEQGSLWVEYTIVEQESEQVATIEREGQRVELAGRVALQPDQEGKYRAQVRLGYGVVLSPEYHLRAYLVPDPSQDESKGNGNS